MDQAPIMPKNWKPSQKTSAPIMPKDWGKEEVVVEKKKPTALPSPSEKPAVSSVAGLRPMVPSSASKSAEAKPVAKAEPKPIAKPIAKAQPKPIAKPAAKQAPAQQESMSVISGQSQGKLLIPEPMQKVPAQVETVTTKKVVPAAIKAPKIDKELMLDAIALHETGSKQGVNKVGMPTKLKGSARGTFQMIEPTLRGIYNQSTEYKKQFKNFDSFEKEFNKNPALERDVASTLLNQYDHLGIHALGAWYNPDLAAKAASGSKKALNAVPNPEFGNRLTYGGYFNSVKRIYDKLRKEKYSSKNAGKEVVTTKQEVKVPAFEVPSLERFDVTNKNWYPTPTKENVDVLAKNTLQKSKDVASNIKLFNSDAQALAQDVSRFNALAKANPRDPNLPVLQKQLQQRQLEVENKHKALEGDIKSIDEAKMEINRQAIANYQNKAKQGGWGGFTWNKIIEGLGSVQRGMQEQAAMWSTLGAQTLDLLGIETEELKKKPWLLAGGGDMYRREKVREYQEKTKSYNEDLKLDSTTPEYMQELEKSSAWARALGGVASSAPAMVGGLPIMTMQGIGAFYQQVDQDPYLKSRPKQELDTIAIPLAMGTALLERAGMRTILGKGVGPVAAILNKVFKKIPKNAPMELIEKTFTEIAESQFGKMVGKAAGTRGGKIASRFIAGAKGEAETEAEQGVLEDELKRLYNYTSQSEAFKIAKFASDEYMDKRAEEAKLGAMGSLILGGPIMAIQAVGNGKQISDDDFVAMRDLLNDPEHIVLTRAKLATDVVDEKITPAQAKQQVATDNKTREILNSIPTDLPVKAQREAFQVLWANAKLNQELDAMSKSIEGKDPNLVTAVTNKMKAVEAKIEENNKQLSKISENAFQEQTTSEVPVQPEAGTSQQMAEGESQAEPQVTTQEGQGKEVTIDITNTPSSSSPSLSGNISTPEGNGHFTARILEDGTAYISDIQLGYDQNAPRGKGYGLDAYIQIAEKLRELGYKLESTQWDKHTSSISPQALRVWEKLAEKGYAKIIGQKQNKVYNRETGEEEVRNTNIYEFTNKAQEVAPSTGSGMVQMAPGSAPSQQSTTAAPEVDNRPIAERQAEAESKIKRNDLFEGVGDFSSMLGGSDKGAVPVSHTEINGIEFVQYAHPDTGSVDVIVTGTSNNDLVGFYRIYENGKPTNKWSSKFENKSRNKENFKTMISGVQSMLPKGHEYTEKTSISTDGLRVWDQQLGKGYGLQYDQDGNLVTTPVFINGESINNDLGIPVESGNFNNVKIKSKQEFEKAKAAILPYLQKFNLGEQNIRWVDGSIEVDLPVLKQAEIAQAATEVTPTETQTIGVETITANIPKQDLPKVMDLVARIKKGEQVSSPEDLQTQQNYAKEVEALLANTEEAPTTIATVDVTTPAKFEEGQMPEMSADQIDWEASGMGTQQEAIDKFGGINDITVVELQGKNDQGQYVGRVRVLGQDNSKEGVLVFKDPNAPAQAEEVVTEQVEEKTPEQTKIESVKKLLSDKGVYPINTRVNGLLDLAESKPGEVTPEDVQSVVKVNNTKAKSIASALNKQAKQEAKAAEQEAGNEEKQKKEATKMSVDQAMEKAKEEGLTKDLIADAGLEALRQTEEYKKAEQQDRDLMEDGVRKKAGLKRKAAPSAKKILGIKPDKVTVNEAVARNEQIRLEIKAANGAVKAVQEATAKLVADIKALGQKGKLTPAQTRALLNGLDSNLLNPVIRDRVFARAKRIIENANYAKNVEDANSAREKIKKLLSANNKKPRTNRLAGSVANMATNFARLSPKMVDDIDLYLERANEVLAAIRNPKITDMDVTGRIAADIAAVNEYANSEFDKQEEARKEEMFAQYEYLVEAGVLDPSMSLKDINKVIAEINKGDKVDNKKLKEQGTVFFRMLFNDYAGIIKKMLSGTDPITGEPTNISEGDKELVRRFININPDLVNDFMDMFNMANAAQEFITNGIIDNMEVMIRHAKGKELVKEDADNPKMRGYKAILPWIANIAKIPLITNIINTKLAPVQEYLRNVFRGETNAARFEKNSGFTDIVNGSTKALGESDATDKNYAETFDKKKPNGKKFFDISNVFERGIFADLFRTTPGSVEENRAEFVRKREQLELTIEEKRNSDKKSDNLEAEELQKAYDKIVEGSKDINDVMSKMAPENIDGVMWWINKWDEYFDKIDRVSKSLYNTTLERQNNYTPEGWVKIADKMTQDDDMMSRSFNKMNMSYLDTRRAGTLMKYNGNPGLPKNDNTGEVTHVKSYHFDVNNSESFGKTLKDVYTAPGMVQYMAYVNSPEFSTIIPDKNTRENLKEKLAFAINALKDSEIDISPDFVKNYNKAMKKFVDISRAQALVSIKTPILQTVPVVVGTAIDLMNDPASFAKSLEIAANMDFHEALNKSGYGIAVRGLEAIAAMDAAEKRIAESSGVDLNLFNNIAKLGNAELKWLLSKPDIVAARQAWAAYYVHKLKAMGMNTSNIDWNTHEFNEEAANYAERKTSSKLNQNIQELSGKVFASRSQTNRAIRNIVLNFASFSYNMKYRFWTDMVVLGSKNSNSMDKADAAKDIVRTVGESALYIYINSILAYWVKQGIYNLIGYDEPEEEKKKADEYLTTNMLTKGLVDLLSPMPGIGDLLFVKGINSLADLAFGEQEEEQPNKEKLFFVKARPEVEKQFRLYEPPEKTEIETYLSLLGGMSSIFGKNIYDVYKTAALINEGESLGVGNKKVEYTDKYDNKIEFSNKEKEMMKLPFLAQTLGTIGLGFRDQAEAARKVRSSLEKRAKKRTAASKKEKLFFVKEAE